MLTAVITGINGQDGFYLAKLLLKKGYKVVGVQRRTSTSTAWRLDDLPDKKNLVLEAGDITDLSSIIRIVKQHRPHELYNLAAQSQVWHSFQTPLATCDSTGLGALVCLEAIRQEAPQCAFYQAGSSEQFGNSAIHAIVPGGSDDELAIKNLNIDSPMIPRSPYGAAKLFAHNMVRNYREAYDMFAVGGILFNHESPYRGVEFVTRKVTDGVAAIVAGSANDIVLGNLDSFRDWGHAEDYMRAAWMMLQQGEPVDYLIATGESYSVRQFITLAFLCVGIDDWEQYITQTESLMRPSEVDVLIGDSSKARKDLGWKPNNNFVDLVYEMVEADCRRRYITSKLADKSDVIAKWESAGKLA